MNTRLLTITLLSICAATARADTLLIQSGEDSSPYSFTAENRRGFASSAYAFTASSEGVDHSFEYYIRFNLPAELFEPGVLIDYAYAWVYYGFDFTAFGDTTNEVGQIICHEVLAPWSQATLTWTNRPPIGPEFDGWDGITKKGLYWCDVTDLVEGWIAGEPNYGIALTSDAHRVMGYHTFEDGSVSPNFRPSLVVPEPPSSAGLSACVALLVALARRRTRRIASAT